MKYLLILLLIPVLAFAQQPAKALASDDVYIPRTLSAGTSMSTRTDAAALLDTTQSIQVRGFAQVIITLQTFTNDSVGIRVSYQPSFDGVTYAATFVVIDSLSTTGTVGYQKGFVLPQAAMGFHSVRVRVDGTSAAHSVNPAATVTTRIARKQY